MLPYLVFFFIIFTVAVIGYATYNDDRNMFLVNKNPVAFVGISCLVGLFSGSRVELGGYDYGMYRYFFEICPKNLTDYLANKYDHFLDLNERGYIAAMILFKSLNLNFNIFLLVLGLLCSLAMMKMFRKYFAYYYLALFVFIGKGYLYFFFTAQRQIIAMVICWLSLKYIFEKKLFRFSLLVVIASLFHSSAIMFFFVYFIARRRMSNKTAVILIISSILLGVLHFGSILMSYLMVGISQLIPAFNVKLFFYFNTVGEHAVNILNLIELVPLAIIVLVFRSRLERKVPNFNFFLVFFMVYFVTTIAFMDFSILARFRSYFIFGYLGIFISLVDIPTNKKYGVAIIFLISFYILAVFVRELMTFDGGAGFLPYQSFILNLIL